MKIAIPVDNESMDSTISKSFGRTNYFLIIDTDSMEHTFIENSAVASQGGAGIKAAQLIVDQKVKALLAPRCGQNAAEVIKAAGIEIYKTINDSIEDNINSFKEDKLSLLKEIHAGFHNHGGN